jgi:hypothetical protein
MPSAFPSEHQFDRKRSIRAQPATRLTFARVFKCTTDDIFTLEKKK